MGDIGEGVSPKASKARALALLTFKKRPMLPEEEDLSAASQGGRGGKVCVCVCVWSLHTSLLAEEQDRRWPANCPEL